MQENHLHDQHPSKSFIDLNRTGVALMEIVSKPDIRSPQEAGAYVKKIRSILSYTLERVMETWKKVR